MSDLLFNARETSQRELDLAEREPTYSFWDKAGYAGQRVSDAIGAAQARIAEGIFGPVLETSARDFLNGPDDSLIGGGPAASLPREVRENSAYSRFTRENEDWRELWQGVERRAQDGMADARAMRRQLDAPDPNRTSLASEMIYGLTQMLALGTAGGGPAGALGSAAVLGPSYGVPAYHDFIDEGVDEETARNAAFLEGGSMALLGALPISVPGNFLTRVGSGVAINVPFGMGYRGSMASYLRSKGYEEQASRYKWNDGQMIATDAIMGAVFAGLLGPRATGATVRPRGDGGETPGGEGPQPNRDGDWYFEEARQLANDGDLEAAYAHALLANEMGHGEAIALAEMIAEEGGETVVQDGNALASIMALRDGMIEPPQDLINAAMTMQSDHHARVDTAPGVPLDLNAEARHAESLARAERQFANGEEVDVGDVWAEEGGAFAPHPDDLQAMATEIEHAQRALRDAPQGLANWVRRRGVSDDRGDIAGMDDRGRGASAMLAESGRPLDELIEAAVADGFFPDYVDGDLPDANAFRAALEQDIRKPGSVTNDNAAAFSARNARDVLRHYERNGVDTSLRGEALREALSPLTRQAEAEAAIRQVLDEEGFPELAREVEEARARIRSMGGEIPPDDAFFSMGPRRGPLYSQGARPIFESTVERVVARSTTARATGAQWWATISKASGVKREELEWIGLEDWLKAEGRDSVTREEVLQFVRENGVRVEETVLGGGNAREAEDQLVALPLIEERTRLDTELDTIGWKPYDQLSDQERARVAEIEARQLVIDRELDVIQARLDEGDKGTTRWSQYTLPGGENYRELLLRLPERDTITREPSQAPNGWGDTAGGNQGFVERGNTGADFRSSHWDAPNVLAHVRFNERTATRALSAQEQAAEAAWVEATPRLREIDAELEVLANRPSRYERAAELQAALRENRTIRLTEQEALDLQHGEGKVTRLDNAPRQLQALLAERDALLASLPERPAPQQVRTLFIEEVQSDWHQAGRERGYRTSEFMVGAPVPDAPFKNNAWASLAMKRMIRWAAENGFDQIAWTRGQHQIERFSLEKHVDALEWRERSGTEGTLIGRKDGANIINQTMDASELPGMLGQEMAAKLLAQPREGPMRLFRTLSGVDLKTGGEGMRAFYDRILPNIANDLGKKFGARVGETQVTADKEGWHITPPDQTVSGRWMVKSSDYNSQGLHFDTEAEARAALAEKQEGAHETVHSLPITPEMREQALDSQPLFARGGEGFSTVAELEARAAEEFGVDAQALAHAGKSVLVETASELPFEVPENATAVHYQGRSYFIADRISVEEMVGKMLHEVGWHEGLEGLVGKRGVVEINRQLSRMYAEDHPLVREAVDRALETSAIDRLSAEAGAYVVEFAEIAREGKLDKLTREQRNASLAYLIETRADLPLVNRILSRLRQWLIKTFGSTFGMRLTVDDLRALAVTSLRRVAEQARREGSEAVEVLPVQEALFSFGGRNSQALNPVIARAQQWARDKKSAKFIWERTWDDNGVGVYRGLDGEWRAEIDDSNAEFRPDVLAETRNGFGTTPDAMHQRFTGRMADVLDHYGLFDAYPWLADQQVTVVVGWGGRGEYNRDTGRIWAQGKDADEAMSALMHEVEHRIQEHEDWSAGSNWRTVGYATKKRLAEVEDALVQTQERGIGDNSRKALEDARDALRNTLEVIGNDTGHRSVWDTGSPAEWAAYEREAGEVEARNVQTRLRMSVAQRRARNPNETIDVPRAEVYDAREGLALTMPEEAVIASVAAEIAPQYGLTAEQLLGRLDKFFYRGAGLGWELFHADDRLRYLTRVIERTARELNDLPPAFSPKAIAQLWVRTVKPILRYKNRTHAEILAEMRPAQAELPLAQAKVRLLQELTQQGLDRLGIRTEGLDLRSLIGSPRQDGASMSEARPPRQNRPNLLGAKRDPIDEPNYQRSLRELQERAKGERQGGAGEGEGRGPGSVRGVSGDAARSRSAGSDARGGFGTPGALRELLAVSGIRITTKPAGKVAGAFGEYRAQIDTPFASDADGALQAGPGADGGPTLMDFDLIDGSNPKDTRLPGVHLRLTRVNDGAKGAKVGIWLYRQIIEWADRRGLPVYSDSLSISAEAQRVYAALEKRGYHVEKVGRTIRDAEDGALLSPDGGPIYRVSVRDPEAITEPLTGAPLPREDYQIDGPTLRERQQRIDEQRKRQEEYDNATPVEQVLKDEPDILFSIGSGRKIKASEAIEMSVEAQRRAVEMKKGYDAAVRCALRHGGSMAARSFVTAAGGGATQAAAASQMLGQGLGLAASIPGGWAASHLANEIGDPRGLRTGRVRGRAAGLDAPAEYNDLDGEPLWDNVDTSRRAGDDAVEADTLETPRQGQSNSNDPARSGVAQGRDPGAWDTETPTRFSAEGGGLTREGARVPPAPPSAGQPQNDGMIDPARDLASHLQPVRRNEVE